MNNEHYSKTHLNMTKITEFSNSLKRHCMTHCFIASYCFDIGLPAPANSHWASSARNAEEGIAGSSPRKLRNSRLPFVTNQWSTLNHRLRDKKPKTIRTNKAGESLNNQNWHFFVLLVVNWSKHIQPCFYLFRSRWYSETGEWYSETGGGIRKLVFGNWKWYSETGQWYSETGQWYSETGQWYSETGQWYSETGTVVFGNWYSETGSGIRKLESGIRKLGVVFGNWKKVFGNWDWYLETDIIGNWKPVVTSNVATIPEISAA